MWGPWTENHNILSSLSKAKLFADPNQRVYNNSLVGAFNSKARFSFKSHKKQNL